MSFFSPENGYPLPGKQNTTPNEVMKQIFFVTDEEWKTMQQTEEFDYVVIGSSYCALSFISKVAKNNPCAKILVLEQGQYFHPGNFQNLSPVFKHTWRGASETFPWSITEKTHQGRYIKWQHGMCNFFGGRSLFWSGWCPEPTTDEMEHWPPEVIKVVHDYFGDVRELMNITTVDQVFEKKHAAKPVYGKLQEALQHALEKVPENVEAVTRMIPGPMSIKCKEYRYKSNCTLSYACMYRYVCSCVVAVDYTVKCSYIIYVFCSVVYTYIAGI